MFAGLRALAAAWTAAPGSQRRGEAMQTLAAAAQAAPTRYAYAERLFADAIRDERSAWIAIHAARGLQAVAGPAAAHPAWRKLLARDDPEFVAQISLAIVDPALLPDLVALLTHPHAKVRGYAARSLGRLRDPRALAPLVALLDDADARSDAIEALGDLGDAGAVTALEALLDDRTDCFPEDNHGPMLRVCDLAERAIASIRRSPLR